MRRVTRPKSFHTTAPYDSQDGHNEYKPAHSRKSCGSLETSQRTHDDAIGYYERRQEDGHTSLRTMGALSIACTRYSYSSTTV